MPCAICAATPHGTPLHKFWHCPAHAAVRFEGAEHLKALHIDNMPHHMLLGIPGTYDALPNAHYAAPIASEGVDLNFLGSIGITFKGIPSSHALNFADAHKACLSQLDNIQFASAFLDDARPTTRPTIVACCGAPPCEPNVWGDGSKLRANTGHFSTSSFGMWEPHRSASSLSPRA